MSAGFSLRRLTLAGDDRPDATVELRPGLNVIVGPSDTGKTYIAQCVDFQLGSRTSPKAIPEAAGYTRLQLELEARADGRRHVLKRPLAGGAALLSTNGEPDLTLRAKHEAGREDTLSAFLLRLSGFGDVRVRTNAAGKTRPLSFRDLAPLVLVDEAVIIGEGSPMLSGQRTSMTAETRVFRYLLTGDDDSSIVEVERADVVRSRQSGQVEILERLLERAQRAMRELDGPDEQAEAQRRLTALSGQVEAAMRALTEEQEAATTVERRRRDAWTALRKAESHADVLRELQTRFVLLEQQYQSDLERLVGIAEAGRRLGELAEERCPVCGAARKHQQRDHAHDGPAVEDILQACHAETAKTSTLLADLQATNEANAAELDRLEGTVQQHTATLAEIDAELHDRLRPRLAHAATELREVEAQRRDAERTVEAFRSTDELSALLAAAQQPVTRAAPGLATAVTTGEAEGFAREMEALLHAWHVPGVDRVTFSEQEQDVVISGHPRGSRGKGVRAITHAAFTLALLRWCLNAGRPYTAFALIDSPLVVYREPDPGEGAFPLGVKNAFYRSLAERFADAQVVILENDAPPADVSANVITFTGTERGRAGFIPKA